MPARRAVVATAPSCRGRKNAMLSADSPRAPGLTKGAVGPPRRRPFGRARIIAEMIRAAQAGVGAASTAHAGALLARAAAGRLTARRPPRRLLCARPPAKEASRKLAKLAAVAVCATDDVGLEPRLAPSARLAAAAPTRRTAARGRLLALTLEQLEPRGAKPPRALPRRAPLKLPAGSLAAAAVFEGSLPSRDSRGQVGPRPGAAGATPAMYARHESMRRRPSTLQNLSEAAPGADPISPS